MNAYLGFDIGTTNYKTLLLSEDGEIVEQKINKTPQVIKNGFRYLDIDVIEEGMNTSIAAVKQRFNLKAVGFSSIGESVVPVKAGKAMSLPLVWYEEVSGLNNSQWQEITEQTGYAVTGVHPSKTYSLHKMTWMQKNILQDTPDYWLPLSSYFIYRRTGQAVWDTSQASRSYLYDIHNKTWLFDLINRQGITVPGEIKTAGSHCGENDGTIYGLGGHDHYMGLFSIYKMQDQKELFYDSMGSSSVLAALYNDSRKEVQSGAIDSKTGGCLVSGFAPEEYIVNRSMDYYGRILSCLGRIRGIQTDQEFYGALNKKIESQLDSRRLCYVVTKNDYSRYSDVAANISFLSVREDTSYEELVLSGYLYMILGTKKMYQELSQYQQYQDQEYMYYAGGGIIHNELFMKLKATALDRRISLVNTTEISALGAAAAGMCASGDEALLKKAGAKLLRGKAVLPDQKYCRLITGMEERYAAIQG